MIDSYPSIYNLGHGNMDTNIERTLGNLERALAADAEREMMESGNV